MIICYVMAFVAFFSIEFHLESQYHMSFCKYGNKMTQTLAQVSEIMLAPGNLTPEILTGVLGQMVNGSIDFADIYFQSVRQESWVLEESMVKQGSFDIEQGVGVRAVAGDKSGLAYANDLNLNAIKQAASSASGIVKAGQAGKVAIPAAQDYPLRYPAIDPFSSITDDEKIRLLQHIDQVARDIDPRVKEVVASLYGEQESVLIINSEGDLVTDVRPLVRLYVHVIVEENGRRESGSSGGGRRLDYLYFTDEAFYLTYVNEAVRLALVSLEAIAAPAGEMPVVLGPGWPGVLLHEAVGHGLEGDFNRKGSSAFTGLIGETVATPLCTVVDDGTLADRRGSVSVDDEGTPGECTVLIENGVLKTYMTDRLNAKLLKMPCTGNGRRESYDCLPIPRMTNTYMLPGDHEQDDIIASVERGLFAVNFAGGQVDITSGNFVFSTSEAYLIENGKVTRPVKDATLVGEGPQVLKRVSMVGNDLKLDDGVGTCGKDGQSVPVGVGQPTLKVDAMTVGGTA